MVTIHLPRPKMAFIDIVSQMYMYIVLVLMSQEFDHSGSKEVSFNVHGIVYVPVSPGDSDPLEKEIRTLGELLQQVKDEQEYIKIRERTHRNSNSQLKLKKLMIAAESTNARVKWWSIFQTGVLIGVCCFQVAYLKRYFGQPFSVAYARFFEVKRVV